MCIMRHKHDPDRKRQTLLKLRVGRYAYDKTELSTKHFYNQMKKFLLLLLYYLSSFIYIILTNYLTLTLYRTNQ